MHRPLVISHRTQMGTMPENTLAGIEAAIEGGADGIEIDVRATADGELVLLHDASLARTTDGGDRALSEVTLEELRAVRVLDGHGAVGEQPVPTFAETLDWIDGRALFVIELKETGLEERVAAAVRARKAADWCWIWAFDPRVVAASRAALSEVPAWQTFSAASLERFGVDPFESAPRVGAAGVSVRHDLVTAELVERARHRGLLVATWTVNEPADLERVRDTGVDAICGDFPDRTIAALG
jgi:glycerophosphoryl diester phosphodiesterase